MRAPGTVRAWWLGAVCAWALVLGGAQTVEAEAPAPPSGRHVSDDGDSAQREAPRRSSEEARRAARKKAEKKKRAKRSSRTRGARDLNTEWHKPAQPGDCEALVDAPEGSWGLMSLAAKTCFAVPPLGAGPVAEETLARVRAAFVDKRDGGTHDIDLRLLRVLERAVREFDVPYVHLVSGFRGGRTASRHAHGLAADVVFPGVTNKRLAAFVRQQGFMGVGIYMRTGFVHVDVRERSYFWLDWSPPGKKWRGKPILMAEAREADEAAVARGEEPFEEPRDLQRAVDAGRARRAKARAAQERREAARRREAKKRRAARKRREAARRRAAAARRERARQAQAERRAEPRAEAPTVARSEHEETRTP